MRILTVMRTAGILEVTIAEVTIAADAQIMQFKLEIRLLTRHRQTRYLNASYAVFQEFSGHCQ